MPTLLGQSELKFCEYMSRFEMEVEGYLDVGIVLSVMTEVGVFCSDGVVDFCPDHLIAELFITGFLLVMRVVVKHANMIDQMYPLGIQ